MPDLSPRNLPAPRVAARLVLLLALLAGGLVVAGLGVWFTGKPIWWLAVPAAVAIGWLFVADPTACVAPEHAGANASTKAS
jgi:hypothetical protein